MFRDNNLSPRHIPSLNLNLPSPSEGRLYFEEEKPTNYQLVTILRVSKGLPGIKL